MFHATRLAELRDVVLDLRNKQDQETGDRRSLEQLLQQKYVSLYFIPLFRKPSHYNQMETDQSHIKQNTANITALAI